MLEWARLGWVLGWARLVRLCWARVGCARLGSAGLG